MLSCLPRLSPANTEVYFESPNASKEAEVTVPRIPWGMHVMDVGAEVWKALITCIKWPQYIWKNQNLPPKL